MVIYSKSGVGDDAEREATFLERIQSLPSKPHLRQRKATSRDLVIKYYDALKRAHDRGQDYEDLALVIEEELGVIISPGTLRKYMAYAKTQASTHVPSPEMPEQDSPELPSAQSVPQARPKGNAMSPERRDRLFHNAQPDDIESQFSNLS